MKQVFILWIILITSMLYAQPYQGGESSGFDYQSVIYCNTNLFSFQSTGIGSGFDSSAFFACSDIIKYTGSGMGSGFDFKLNNYCDSLNQKPSFKGDSLSGFHFSSLIYCVPIFARGDSMSGHFYASYFNCIPYFARGDSMSGHFFNVVNYCIPISYNGTNASGFARSVGNCLIPLPIDLLEFYAFKQNQKALLAWKVTNEVYVDYYEVLRSLDLQHFAPIHLEKALGNNSPILYYSALDSNPAMGINYYQIAIHDYDGKVHYSEIKEIDFSEIIPTSTPIIIYPNPLIGNMPLNIWVTTSHEFSIEIWDLNGKILWKKDFDNNYSLSAIEISTEQWSKGVYILRYKNSQNEYFQKIIKY